ncbi:1-phosphofructokinase [Rhodococcus opacus PD630]|uniref:1-phosphofructokinase n=1 Tax=Rhodococcus TaxID=1827 RepID=UPI00029CC7E5|nr:MULTISPECIES: 1-phosphofructokinase [Rhodococcus]KXF53214.1 1-phosphofructokinase [Rhodococcus sp. SC4]AHK30623.1 Tagatose-6-phosphate kinase [Rhodococcus opacus PD630]EHI46930.1 1-phosphofructokinase [Rhodococcus opacus PD630]KXX54888.1 1-phosphofructokinase [Rhodococcus sp. LB1]UDH00236.1 1-phosphofructokinase [Rhodococcus opacus PD630]
MIVTLTANPSIDRTVNLAGRLERGTVLRAAATHSDPGGKGVNVARALTSAGVAAVAVLPGNEGDPLLTALSEHGIAHVTVATSGPARTNITITEPDGTTTKVNEPGVVMSAESLADLQSEIIERGSRAEWVVLSGSLPPGIPTDWYATLVEALRSASCRVAVDTSDAPLRALAERFPAAAPDLVKPNSEELAQLTGADGQLLEESALRGDPTATAHAGRQLVDRGVEAVLATLGAAGAVLVTEAGAWWATPPPIVARSTVGAGDSSLAGYLAAQMSGATPADCLRSAVAYGSAAAALPGTTLPTPEHVDIDAVTVTALSSPAPDPA